MMYTDHKGRGDMAVMQEQKDIFKRISFASVRNIVGFGVVVWGISYLSAMPDIKKPALVLAAIIVLIMITTMNALMIFTYYTIKSIPTTMQEKDAGMSFQDIYGFTLAGITLRLVEAGVYIYYIVYLYRLFFV
ncbi:MAG: hypothetical protein U9N81_01170 [Bacillota bacterium]|nr:hypothetical protein [Bacillota bacterium]